MHRDHDRLVMPRRSRRYVWQAVTRVQALRLESGLVWMLCRSPRVLSRVLPFPTRHRGCLFGGMGRTSLLLGNVYFMHRPAAIALENSRSQHWAQM